MKQIILVVIILVVSTMFVRSQQPPLVDGDCSEYTFLKKAEFHDVSADVRLYMFQDEYFVWFCYGYPEGSFGTMDLKLKSPKFPAGLNLHVSAQLGEWPLNKPELAPKDGESELWWNTVGWTANAVWMNGLDRSSTEPRIKFKNAKARELQLSKERFGKGDWNFSIEIRAIKGRDGKLYKANFPATGEFRLKAR